MAQLTPAGQQVVDDAARRYGLSQGAVRVLLEAVIAGGGGMAQFSHPELGGMGQWSRGGMIMIGDMFNNGLKNHVASLCDELSDAVGRGDVVAYGQQSSQWQSQGGTGGMPLPANSFFVGDAGGQGGNWWPSDLGMPASSGAQNNMRYACFPDRRRFALDLDGRVSVYDTGDHWITGFSQQQGGDQSLLLSSQMGNVRLDSLALVSEPNLPQGPARKTPAPVAESNQSDGGNQSRTDVFALIERLAGLRDKGLLSEDEFSTKKADLLKRL